VGGDSIIWDSRCPPSRAGGVARESVANPKIEQPLRYRLLNNLVDQRNPNLAVLAERPLAANNDEFGCPGDFDLQNFILSALSVSDEMYFRDRGLRKYLYLNDKSQL